MWSRSPIDEFDVGSIGFLLSFGHRFRPFISCQVLDVVSFWKEVDEGRSSEDFPVHSLSFEVVEVDGRVARALGYLATSILKLLFRIWFLVPDLVRVLGLVPQLGLDFSLERRLLVCATIVLLLEEAGEHEHQIVFSGDEGRVRELLLL